MTINSKQLAEFWRYQTSETAKRCTVWSSIFHVPNTKLSDEYSRTWLREPCGTSLDQTAWGWVFLKPLSYKRSENGTVASTMPEYHPTTANQLVRGWLSESNRVNWVQNPSDDTCLTQSFQYTIPTPWVTTIRRCQDEGNLSQKHVRQKTYSNNDCCRRNDLWGSKYNRRHAGGTIAPCIWFWVWWQHLEYHWYGPRCKTARDRGL